MIRSADQAYLRTRLSILHNRLRRPQEIEQLIRLPAAELLASFHIEPGDANRQMQQFEQSMLQVWLDEMSALLRPLNGPAREILVQWARRYELFNLKALIRGKTAGLSKAEISASLFQLPGFLSLDHERLLHTDDIGELLRRLDGTAYQSIARQAHRRFIERQDHFLLDAALDQYFYNEMLRHCQPLDEPDRSQMRELLGGVIDRHNLVWMLRYRYNYGLSPAEAHYLSIEQGQQLSSDLLGHLVEKPDVAAFLAALPARLRQICGETQDIVIIEQRMQRHLQQTAERFFQHSPSIVAVALAYLILRFLELHQLYAIIQARMLGLHDQLLREALDPELREAA
ncbi:MAG: V-type ATPase subunit [Gammaproteobacteria bacterium]|nr:V-type ATPase subunit [Gammaproteobacteria bacterium]